MFSCCLLPGLTSAVHKKFTIATSLRIQLDDAACSSTHIYIFTNWLPLCSTAYTVYELIHWYSQRPHTCRSQLDRIEIFMKERTFGSMQPQQWERNVDWVWCVDIFRLHCVCQVFSEITAVRNNHHIPTPIDAPLIYKHTHTHSPCIQ